jgi:hypothetical protein
MSHPVLDLRGTVVELPVRERLHGRVLAEVPLFHRHEGAVAGQPARRAARSTGRIRTASPSCRMTR